MMFFSIIMVLLLPTETKAEEMVNVKLVKDIGHTNELTFRFHGTYLTLDPSLQLREGVEYTLKKKKRGLFSLMSKKEKLQINGSFMLVPHEYDTNHYIEINGKPYLGAIEFTEEKGKYIRPVNQLPLEDYLKGVVPFEVFSTWSLETLKAQALAARTYAITQRSKEMNDTIQYQVYGGFTWDPKTTQAVEETKGEIITYQGKPITAFYSASNGGVTENNKHVWGGQQIPIYPIKKDEYDPIEPWKFTLHKDQLNLEEIDWYDSSAWDDLIEVDSKIAATMKSYLKRVGYLGDIKIISVPTFEIAKDKNPSGRTMTGSIEVSFLHRLFDGTIMLEQLEIRNGNINKIRPLIGGDIFRSYLIDSLTFEDGHYTMSGRGYGHGVGMSQWGASVMGDNGKNYKEIIQYYFPRTSISQINAMVNGKE